MSPPSQASESVRIYDADFERIRAVKSGILAHVPLIELVGAAIEAFVALPASRREKIVQERSSRAAKQSVPA